MDSNVRRIRSFLIRKMTATQRSLKHEPFPDPYRRGYIEGLSMVQSFIDKVIVKEEDEKNGTVQEMRDCLPAGNRAEVGS